jgi:hypothetical protein
VVSEAAPVPFQAHVELLRWFLAQRGQVVERIHGLLNAQDKPLHYQQDRRTLARQVEDCFFTLPATSAQQLQLRGQLQAVHWASGFRPREMPEFPNDLVEPAEMMMRAFQLWRGTRWPGRNGRIRYAQTLFNLYLMRCLELLVLRLWDAGAASAGERLASVQGVLDELWKSSPADQPVLLRDARWLIPLAQSPTTDDLAPYFVVAEKVAGSLTAADRLEIHKATVLMAGGHLRSQLRHFTMQGATLADASLVLSTRGTNALDFSMTIQGLVPMLKAYAQARSGGDRGRQLELAGAICQGISADPELFVNRVDLLGAYTMIEHLFIATDATGQVAYTAMGKRHVGLLREYAALVAQLAQPLHEDCANFRPVEGTYSPHGVMYGYSSNITEHMSVKVLQPDAVTRFSMEDVFVDADPSAEKLAWVSSWRKLPHMSAEVQRLYAYPQTFAEEIFGRIELALRTAAASSTLRTGRLFIVAEGDAAAEAGAANIPELPREFVLSSDEQLVAANKAQPCDEPRLLHRRQEGEFIVSYRTAGGWVAITKDMLTAVLGVGRDARVSDLPVEAAAVLRLMCRGLPCVQCDDSLS